MNSIKNLTFGMSGAGIDLQSLCRIIREGARAGVSRLKTSDLELEFHQDQLSSVSHKQGMLFTAGQPRGKKKSENESAEMIVENIDNENLEDHQDIQLLIDDPVAYESRMISNHLDTSGERGHEGTQNFGSERPLQRR